MRKAIPITTLFPDIGGVRLTNGRMFAQSIACPEMIELVVQLKVRYGLKIAVAGNEARGLNAYRIRKFKLNKLVDSFISSCFVHVRKPGADIFRLALDIAQAPTQQLVYIENTPIFIQIAESLGIRGIPHTDYGSTCLKMASFRCLKMASFRLQNDGEVIHETS
jgi:putative hydrolase of the HAD superfamily